MERSPERAYANGIDPSPLINFVNTAFSETIVAIASPPGPAARGIIRVSGPEVHSVVDQIFQPASGSHLAQHSASRITGCVNLPCENRTIALPVAVYYWPTGRSYTGEPLAEFHTISSPPLLNLLLRLLCSAGARPAEPGEYTMRAFLNSRINLMQAEAVLGVIDAHNTVQLTTALSQLAGGISGQMQTLREQLLLHLADLEAGLDFVEEDIDFVSREELQRRLCEAVEILSRLTTQSSTRLLTSGSRTVVLAGLPNAGKSSLLNALVGEQAAIVSPIAGTTRDFVRAALKLDGFAVELIDTAGWEENPQGIEALVAQQKQAQLRQADLILWCSAADQSPQQSEIDHQLFLAQEASSIPVMKVVTKGDLLDTMSHIGTDVMILSSHSANGLEKLREELVESLKRASEGRAELISSTTARCQQSLKQALTSATQALNLARQQAGDELISLELREVLEHLGQILGAVYTEDILDRIFSRFCIGK